VLAKPPRVRAHLSCRDSELSPRYIEHHPDGPSSTPRAVLIRSNSCAPRSPSSSAEGADQYWLPLRQAVGHVSILLMHRASFLSAACFFRRAFASTADNTLSIVDGCGFCTACSEIGACGYCGRSFTVSVINDGKRTKLIFACLNR
jgi:hypothetical protein